MKRAAEARRERFLRRQSMQSGGEAHHGWPALEGWRMVRIHELWSQ
jgi:hypothetical protein